MAERAIAGGIELPDQLADRYLDEIKGLLTAASGPSLKREDWVSVLAITRLLRCGPPRGPRRQAETALCWLRSTSCSTLSTCCTSGFGGFHSLPVSLGPRPPSYRMPSRPSSSLEARCSPWGEFDAFTTPFASFQDHGAHSRADEGGGGPMVGDLNPCCRCESPSDHRGGVERQLVPEPELREAAVGGCPGTKAT